MRGRAFARVCALTLCCVWAACSGDGGGDPAPTEVEVRVGVKGGRVALREVTLEIPEGALDKELKLSVREKADMSPLADTKALSKLYEFGPAGTKFNKEIEIRFKVERAEPGAAVFFTKEARPDEFEKLPTTRDARDYVAKVKHFSAGFVGVDESSMLDAGEDAGAASDAAADSGADDLDAEQPDQEAGDPDASAQDDAEVAPDAQPGQDDAAIEAGAPDAGGPDASTAGHIVVHSRDDVGAPANYTWAAFQDGDQPWQPLSPTPVAGTYTFDVTAGRYGVAFVCADAEGVNSRGLVRYAAATTVSVDIDLVITSVCRVGTPAPMHTVYGPLTLPAGNYYYRYGHANASQLNPSMGATTLFASAFPGAVLADLVAGVSSSQDGGLSRVLLVRDLMLDADLMRPFDFVNQASDVGPTYSVLVTDADPAASIDVYYTTRGELGGMPMRQGPTGTPSAGARLLSYGSIPTGLQRADDRYLIRARETVGNLGRELERRAWLASNHSVAMPATFSVEFSMDADAYMRPGMSFADYAGATRYALSWGYFPGSEQHSFELLMDADYLAAGDPYTLVFPDLSGVAGFAPSWVPPTSTTETINLGATAYTYQENASFEQKTSATQTGSYRVAP